MMPVTPAVNAWPKEKPRAFLMMPPTEVVQPSMSLRVEASPRFRGESSLLMRTNASAIFMA